MPGSIHTRVNAARLRLVAGSSSVCQRELGGSRPRWLRVGSEPSADWRVHAQGVAPAHCELLWDGRGLFVQDRLRLGSTYAGKARVDGWLPLPARSVLRIGAAALFVEAPAQHGELPDARVLRWVQQQAEQLYAERRASGGGPTGAPTHKIALM